MNMAEKQEKSSEKGFLARTATYTTKRARRAQEKFMQKVGKLDETKDEVFDEFVNNFNKQQTAASRLQKELKQYIQCLSSMRIASNAFAEAVKDVYEPTWSEREKLVSLYEELDSNFDHLTKRLVDEVLEPLEAYHRPFADVKTKIAKRGRKRVDYDHSRHVVDTLRAKGTAKTADAKKLAQAEDDYQKAKSVFVELTSELYDELPALYDGRIGFYVSCFQSVFTLEGVFHRESAKIQNQLNDMMDQLITDVSAGSYSTKKSFAVTRDEDPIEPKPEGGLAKFYDVAVPDEDDDSQNEDGSEVMNGDESQQTSKPKVLPPAPVRPAPQRPSPKPPAPSSPSDTENNQQKETAKENEGSIDKVASDEQVSSKADNEETVKPDGEELGPRTESIVYKNPRADSSPTQCNLIVPHALYKAVATHSYTAEDEDELAFEKGAIIHVIKFEDPEEQDEGWLMGILDASGLKGVFPENFTKHLET